MRSQSDMSSSTIVLFILCVYTPVDHVICSFFAHAVFNAPFVIFSDDSIDRNVPLCLMAFAQREDAKVCMFLSIIE